MSEGTKNMKDNYISVHKFMSCELGLTGIELLTYATIYSYSKSGQGLFTGSTSYIAEMFGTTRETVTRALSKLVEKGYIIKEVALFKQGGSYPYRVNMKIIDDSIEDVETRPTKTEDKKVTWETVYNNTDNKYDDIVNKFNELWELYGKVGSKKLAFKQWYKLTDEQKDKAYDNVPDYFASLSELKYRKHMERYISQELYLQDFTPAPKTNTLFGSNNNVPVKKRNKLN